ncbi:MAG: D-aminoacylase [Acidobacteriales bacterium]|nr:D-aminoacylase [Terriglobales bacterium]
MRAFLLFFAVLCLHAADYNMIIRNARVVDGTGNPWFRADVGVKDGRIAVVGNLSRASAERVIDARDRVLAPGFIDGHTHLEGDIEKIPFADNYVRDGVTTIVTGNCGDSEVDVAAWFAKLEKIGLGINLATLAGHNDIRIHVMGRAERHATPDELAGMREVVEKAMRDGAVGFSTGLIYIPGTYSSTEEVVELAKAASKYDGIYASHIRDEGAKVLAAIEEAASVGRAAGMRVELSHFKIDNRKHWGESDKSIALVEKFRREGVDVTVDQYPYGRSSTNLGITLPSWALADGKEKIRQRLADPATRQRIAREMKQMLKAKGHKDYSYAMVSSCPFDKTLEGKTIPEIAILKHGKKKLDRQIQTILDLMEKDWVGMVYQSMSIKDVERILRYPNTSVISDGGVREFGAGKPHPRSYGSRARVLAEFVRNRNTITLEDAVRKMTSLPARVYGFRDRGMVREGFCADLVLFDPARVQDKATYENPHQYSEGFDLVLVNGQPVVENDKLTLVRAGRILRGAGYAARQGQ